jgi:hypothetical protein
MHSLRPVPDPLQQVSRACSTTRTSCSRVTIEACISKCPKKGASSGGRREVCSSKGAKSTRGKADDSKAQSLGQHRALDTSACRSEGHAHAYLLRPLGHGIGDDSVDAEGSKQRAKSSENGHEQNEEAARRDRMIDERLQRTEAACGLRGIETAKRDQDTTGESIRFHSRAHDKSCAFSI